MSNRTALSAAQASMARKLTALLTSDNDTGRLWAAADHDPEAALRLTDSLNVRISSLITGVQLLRHEAKLAIESGKSRLA